MKIISNATVAEIRKEFKKEKMLGIEGILTTGAIGVIQIMKLSIKHAKRIEEKNNTIEALRNKNKTLEAELLHQVLKQELINDLDKKEPENKEAYASSLFCFYPAHHADFENLCFPRISNKIKMQLLNWDSTTTE